MEDIFKAEKHEQYTHKKKPIFDGIRKDENVYGKNVRKRKRFKKTSKRFKKSVDRSVKLWYYKQAPSRAPNLENDTEEKKRKKERQLILRVKSITKVMLKD